MTESDTRSCPRFSEFSTEENPLEGDKKRLDDILNQEIRLIGYKICRSKFKDTDYTTLQFELDGKIFITFTGSQVIADQIRRYGAMIPFRTTIKRINKYYTFT